VLWVVAEVRGRCWREFSVDQTVVEVDATDSVTECEP